MPELPEVETIRRDLTNKILNQKIVSVKVIKDNLVRGDAEKFVNILLDNKIKEIRRRGKLLIFVLENNRYLLTHLRMTGQLMYRDDKGVLGGGHSDNLVQEDLPHKFTYIIFGFENGSNLYFNCMRQFGYMEIVDGEQLKTIISKYGVEPLTADFTYEAFIKALGKRNSSIKSLLLMQDKIAGIGNIYADEICFHAGVLPQKSINNLIEEEKEKLFESTNYIIDLAVKERGTTFNNYRDADGNKGNFLNFLKVYGRGGELCLNCNNILHKIKVTGRGTVYCSSCQG